MDEIEIFSLSALFNLWEARFFFSPFFLCIVLLQFDFLRSRWKLLRMQITNGNFKPVPDKWKPFLVLSWGGFVEQLSVTKITFVTIMNLVTLKAGVKLELLFNKLATVLFLAHAPSTWQKYLDEKHVLTFTNTWIRHTTVKKYVQAHAWKKLRKREKNSNSIYFCHFQQKNERSGGAFEF